MVEWKKLGDLLDFEQPTQYLVKSTEYDDAYDTPVLTAGQSLLLGYTDEKDGIYKADKKSPTIIFDDFTTSFHWIDYSFKVKSSAMKMLRPKKNVCFRYVFYAMKCIGFIPGGHQRHWISKYSQFEIPYPSLQEQERIVGILDTFTASIDNLKEQIEQRVKQYEHYRDQLLNLEGKEVELKKLGEVCNFNRGRTITAKDAGDGYVPVIAGGQTPSYYHNEANREGESITVAGSGAYAGFISYWNQPIFVSDAFTVDPTNVLKHKYLYQWLKMHQNKVYATQKGAGVPHVHGKDIANFLIPIPSLQEQERIVGILDTFEASIANLEAQLEQRQKQYEYYREKLLTFE